MPSTSERLERLEEQVSKAQERIDAVNTYGRGGDLGGANGK